MNINILISQILSMYLISALGFVIKKKGIFNDDTVARVTTLLLKFVTFAIIFISINNNLNYTNLNQFLSASTYTVIINVIYMIITLVLVKTKIIDGTEGFALVFSNANFIGIPLISALFGFHAVLYIVPYVLLQFILMWCYGVYLLSNKSHGMFKKIFLNPASLATFSALTLSLLQLKLPSVINTSVESLASLNSPIAMLLLGCFVAQIKLSDIQNVLRLLLVSIGRIFIYALIAIAVFYFIPVTNKEISYSLLIACGAPIAVSTPLFALSNGGDVKKASSLVLISSLLSIISIPLIIYLAEIIL